MGEEYRIRVDFTLDDWTWLCHMLNGALHIGVDKCCQQDLEEVLAVIEAGEAVANG
jgi:hypothetical protein